MKKIPSLAEALAELEDFRHPQGKRYELISILLLACVAMMLRPIVHQGRSRLPARKFSLLSILRLFHKP